MEDKKAQTITSTDTNEKENIAFRRSGLKIPILPKKYMQNFADPDPVIVVAPPRNYESSDFFNGMFAEELSKIPPELHERVAVYVHHHVEARVLDHLSEFRQEIDAQIKFQKQDNLKNVEVMASVTTPRSAPKKRNRTRNKNLNTSNTGISAYVRQIPRTFIDLANDESNPIGGMPLKSWQTAYKDQRHQRSRSSFQSSFCRSSYDYVHTGSFLNQRSQSKSKTSQKMNNRDLESEIQYEAHKTPPQKVEAEEQQSLQITVKAQLPREQFSGSKGSKDTDCPSSKNSAESSAANKNYHQYVNKSNSKHSSSQAGKNDNFLMLQSFHEKELFAPNAEHKFKFSTMTSDQLRREGLQQI